MQLIFGLGNRGEEYKNNRHNFGFMLLDFFATNHQLNFSKSRGALNIKYQDNILVKPQDFMNNSGYCVRDFHAFYKPERILVIYDDLDISFGNFKVQPSFKHNGLMHRGDGGHNGIKSINSMLTTNYIKLRLGISRPDNKNYSDYVLQNFTNEEIKLLPNILEKSMLILQDFINGHPIETMQNKYNNTNGIHIV